jgi:hypothetical protein
MQSDTLNFDLTLERTDEGYFVHVLASPAGEAVSSFQPPFTARDLASLHQLLGWEKNTPDQVDTRLSTLRTLGDRLFQALFPQNIRTCLEESYRLAYQTRVRLSVRLCMGATPEFAHWPWEFLYDRDRQEFLALSTHAPLVRYLELMHQIVPYKVTLPLRLLVVIASPGGHPMFAAQEEWMNLVDTLDHLAVEGKMILELLNKPTLYDLQRRLRQGAFHLLHFVGHALFSAQEHFLLFEDEVGRGRLVSGQHLGALVRDHYSLRLVTLQAGPSATPTLQNPYIGVVQSLLRRGLPAALCLPYALPHSTALSLFDEFYTAIANFQRVDAAVNHTRRVLWSKEQDITWGLPVLWMRVGEGVIFTPAPAVVRPIISARKGW